MRAVRYTLFLKGLAFLLIGFYIASLGIPSNGNNVSIHLGQAVTNNTGDSTEETNPGEALSRAYRIIGPLMIVIGFIEILVGILTFWGYRKNES